MLNQVLPNEKETFYCVVFQGKLLHKTFPIKQAADDHLESLMQLTRASNEVYVITWFDDKNEPNAAIYKTFALFQSAHDYLKKQGFKLIHGFKRPINR